MKKIIIVVLILLLIFAIIRISTSIYENYNRGELPINIKNSTAG